VSEQAGTAQGNLPVTSSAPVELPEKQEALAREVLMALERSAPPYAVAGAFALLLDKITHDLAPASI